MRTALITTTINVPTVLELYRQHGPDVAFFVAGDQKSPHDDVRAFLAAKCATGFESQKQAVGAHYVHPDEQKRWKSSELFGWNTIQRRVFALLAAIEWGADVIVSIDTDDFPTSPSHFVNIEDAFKWPYSGLELRTNSGWVDPGSLIEPPMSHRGIPHRLDRFYVHPAIERKVGVVASTVLGSCDISAFDRMTGLIKRHSASELAGSGAIVDPSKSWTLFNSEAIAFRRELAPAVMVLPFVGRADDLFASMIAQRLMRETGHVVRLGSPAVWHEREDRNILPDLKNEVFCQEHIEHFAACLDALVLQEGSAIERLRWIWNCMPKWMPDRTVEAALAWLDDCEAVL